MIRGRDDLIASHIRSARSYLDEAILLAIRNPNGAVNRLYSACYYAVKALLCSRGLSANRHAKVRWVFAEHFVKRGVITKEMAGFYDKLFESRQESDSDQFFQADPKLVILWLDQAQKFIEAIERLLPP